MTVTQANGTDAERAAAGPARVFVGQLRRGLSSEDKTALALLALTILLIACSGWISPALGSWSQVRATVVLSTFVMLVGFGQQTVMLTGGLDLSVPSIVTLGAVALFSWVGPELTALAWGIPAVIALCAAIGALNGIGVALLRVPPFIMTLAMGMIVSSALLGITGGSPQGEAAPLVVALFAGNWFGVPPVIVLMAVFTVLAVIWQRATVFGRMVYAVGSSPEAARIAGLPVARVTVLCYAVSGAAAGAAGVLFVGFSGGATLDTGQDILIPSIAAVVVGGTAIVGGRGGYLGVVGGALLLTTLSIMVSALGVGAGWRAVLYGSVILLALLALQDDIRAWSTRALNTLSLNRRPGTIQSTTPQRKRILMNENSTRLPSLMRAGLASVTALVMAASASAQTQQAPAQPQKKFKIYLSLFASGGGWITAASNSIKALAATPPYDQMVELHEVISGPEPQKQIAAYESMIAAGADGIITLPASFTALNRTIRKGCDKGVVFFTFGLTVSEPCAYQVQAITNGFGENGGQLMANLTQGKATILANHAFPGGGADKRHYDGFLSAIKPYPNMKVVARTWGNASDEKSQVEAAKVLAAHPNIDAVFTQPGELGIIKAFQAAGKEKLPIVIGEGGNGFRLALADPELRKKGLNGVSSGGTPAEAAFGFKLMMEVLTKQRTMPFRHVAYPLPWVTADDVKICTGDRPKDGCNTFPKDKVPDTFFVSIMDRPDLLPELSLTAVLEGKPTPGATIQKITWTLEQQPPSPGVNCEKCTPPKDQYKVTKVKPFRAK